MTGQFQSTLPHGERPSLIAARVSQQQISIHAPAWGATIGKNAKDAPTEISIHAPAWGATVRSRSALLIRSYFNPRSRMGSDAEHIRLDNEPLIFQSTLPHGERHKVLPLAIFAENISIHAPAWGATTLGITTTTTGVNFNPRSRMGSDLSSFGLRLYVIVFQSTLPHGERPNKTDNTKKQVIISIHAPAWGATIPWMYAIRGPMISIHAPAWGATKHGRIAVFCSDISIHAPAWGATYSLRLLRDCFRISIHAPAWGATVLLHLPADMRRISIHAPAWGATTQKHTSVQLDVFISIHAPAWGATRM